MSTQATRTSKKFLKNKLFESEISDTKRIEFYDMLEMIKAQVLRVSILSQRLIFSAYRLFKKLNYFGYIFYSSLSHCKTSQVSVIEIGKL